MGCPTTRTPLSLESLSNEQEQSRSAALVLLGFAIRLHDDAVAEVIRPGWTYRGVGVLRLDGPGAALDELSWERQLAGLKVGLARLRELGAEQFERLHADERIVRARVELGSVRLPIGRPKGNEAPRRR